MCILNNLGLKSIFDFIVKTPFGIKLITIITVVVYLINLFCHNIFTYWFIDNPILVLKKHQYWRMFFAQFIEEIFGVIIYPYFFCISFSRVEKNMGTVLFLFEFFFKSFMVQVIFLSISIIVEKDDAYSKGLWNVYLAFISLQCFANPDQLVQIVYFLFPFPCLITLPCVFIAKFVPFILAFDSFIFNNKLEPLGIVIYAMIEAYFFNFSILKFSEQFVRKLENSFLFKSFKSRQDFCIMPQNLQAPSENQNQQASQMQIEFQGRGIKIGGSNQVHDIETNISESFTENEQLRQ